MATKRLPNLPFLPAPPPGDVQGQRMNLAVNSLYRNIAQSIDEMMVTATNSTMFPAAQGYKRFAFDGTSLYIDWNTTSWTPIGTQPAITSKNLLVLPEGVDKSVVAGAGAGAGVPVYLPFWVDAPLNISSLDCFFSVGQATAVGSSQAHTLSIRAAILNTANPMVVQQSFSTALAWTVTAGTFSGTGVRRAVLPMTTSLAVGQYVLGLWTSSASSGNALAITRSQMVNPVPAAFTFKGDITSSTFAASNQILRFYAIGAASNTGFSASSAVQASDLVGTQGSQLYPLVYLRAIATV